MRGLVVTEFYAIYFFWEALGDMVCGVVDLRCFPLLSENQFHPCVANQCRLV